MSRIGHAHINIPAGTTVEMKDGVVTVKGKNAEMTQTIKEGFELKIEDGVLTVTRPSESKEDKALHGLYRSLINNMVTGVSKGFERKLNLVGVGFRAQAQGDSLNLSLGFSHPVVHKMPAGVKCETPTQTEIIIKGMSKQQVGQVAAEIRAYRKPEPYKGKGVRYADEVIVLKETKKK